MKKVQILHKTIPKIIQFSFPGSGSRRWKLFLNQVMSNLYKWRRVENVNNPNVTPYFFKNNHNCNFFSFSVFQQ